MVSRALIKTVDTDFVVTAIAHFLDQEIDELWVEFGAGKKKRWLLFHVYAQHLGKQKCLALLFSCAFTGCDTVSSFSGCGEKTAWNVWEAFPEITNVADDNLTLIERFVALLYDRTGSTSSVNATRRWVFTRKGRSIDN